MIRNSNRADALSLYERLLRTRIIEERIADYYAEQEMRTPVHFSIGQEAVSVGVCDALEKEDYVFASHRSHAAYLAKGGSLDGLTAELYGKAAGTNGGRVGSAHISSHDAHMYSGAILGGMVPVAVGTAYGFKLQRLPHIAVAFFGDAAVEEGTVYESLNLAAVKEIPVLFVCENNQFSTSTHIRYRQPQRPIHEMVRSLGVESVTVDGNDVIKVRDTARDAVVHCRRGQPVFIECETYRFREHVGPNFDFDNPYRTQKEVEAWMARCPVNRMREHLIHQNHISAARLNQIAETIHNEVEASIKKAKSAPFPDPDSMFNHVY